MLNIIISEFYKIIKSKTFIVISAIFALMYGISLSMDIYYSGKTRQLLTGITSYQQSYGGDNIFYIILIFVTSLITSEYTNSTIRQMACRGISRWKLVLGQYISIYITLVLILFTFGVLNLISGTFFNELGTVDTVAFIRMNLGILCMIFGVVGIGIFIGYLFKSGVVATTISILLLMILRYMITFISLLTKNDIFMNYSLSSMRNSIIDLTSRPEDVVKYSVVFLLLGLFTITASSLLFSKRDVD